MTFTYVGDLGSDLDKVRFSIQDTVALSGPKPGGVNFTDEELGGLITTEGSWQKAVAGAFEALAAVWALYNNISAGPHNESLGQLFDHFAALAKKWRDDFGSTARVKVYAMTRVDAYSDDIAANEVA